MNSDAQTEKITNESPDLKRFAEKIIKYFVPISAVGFLIACGGNNPERTPLPEPKPIVRSVENMPPLKTETPLTWVTAEPRETPLHQTVEAMKFNKTDTSFVPEKPYTQEIYDEVKDNVVIIKFTDSFGTTKVETASIAKNETGKLELVTAPHKLQQKPNKTTIITKQKSLTIPTEDLFREGLDQGVLTYAHDPESYNLAEGIPGKKFNFEVGTKLLVVGYVVDFLKNPNDISDDSLKKASISAQVVTVVESRTPEDPESITVAGLLNEMASGSVVIKYDKDEEKFYRAGTIYGVNNETDGHLSNQEPYVAFFYPDKADSLVNNGHQTASGQTNP